MTSANGTSLGVMKYDPFGTTRDGEVPTDRLPDALRLYGIFDFTGQRYDDIPTSTGPTAGLYYYGARYYYPELGRFISADTIISSLANPQTINRYSYCLSNPLKYVDPSGHIVTAKGVDVRDIDKIRSNYALIAMLAGSDAAAACDSLLNSNEYLSYDAFRSNNPENILKAITMQENTDHIVNIVESIDSSLYANTITDGNVYTLLISPELNSKSYPGAEFDMGMNIEYQVDKNILLTAESSFGDMVGMGVLDFVFSKVLPIVPALNVLDRVVQGEDFLTVAQDEIESYYKGQAISFVSGYAAPVVSAGIWGSDNYKRELQAIEDRGYYLWR